MVPLLPSTTESVAAVNDTVGCAGGGTFTALGRWVDAAHGGTGTPWEASLHVPHAARAQRPPARLPCPLTSATSSLVIVTVAAAGDPRVAPDGDDSVTVKVSLASTRVSPITGTLTTMLVVPAGKDSVPEVAVKSVPEVAVPAAVA